jgi:VWFA-related protein
MVLVLAGAVWPAAQQPPATPPAAQAPQRQLTFRVEGNYIEVDAVVTDSRGNFVRNLESQDFEVLEDKKPRAVDVFTLVDIPLERPDAPLYRQTPVEPDVVTNEKPLDGRVYVIVLDANHVPATDSVVTKRAAHQFINQYFGANDLGAVVLLQTGRSNDNQEFTSNKAALNTSVDKFIGEKIRSKALNVLEDALSKFSPTGGTGNEDVATSRDRSADERAAKATTTLQALTQLSTSLSGIRGRRKAIVFFSEGIDFNTEDTVGPRPTAGGANAVDNPFSDNTANEAIRASMILEDMQAMYETASRANVAIYTVDPRGVAAAGDAMIEVPGLPQDFPFNLQSITSGLREEFRRQTGTMRTFADATGGLALVGTNDFAGGFQRIVEDNSAYYVLGYHAPDVKPDGKFHEITVRVKRPGLQVRARKGYYASKNANAAAPPDPTISLLNSPLPVGGLGMRMTTATMKGAAPNVHVEAILEFSGSDIMPDVANVPPGDRIELSYAALDLSGKVAASGRKTLDLAVRPETRQSIADHGLRLVTGFDVPPGRYQLRVAAHEIGGGKAGSVFWNLEVPDFTKSAITMGSLVVAATGAVRTPTSYDSTALKDLLPGPPTASREFKLEDTLAVFAEVYDNDAARPHTVDLTATVRTDDGTQVFVTRDERKSQDIKADRGGYTYDARIPLQDLVPGRYVLTVEAKSRLGGDPVTKELQFTIK